jgi:hypothetical protein
LAMDMGEWLRLKTAGYFREEIKREWSYIRQQLTLGYNIVKWFELSMMFVQFFPVGVLYWVMLLLHFIKCSSNMNRLYRPLQSYHRDSERTFLQPSFNTC